MYGTVRMSSLAPLQHTHAMGDTPSFEALRVPYACSSRATPHEVHGSSSRSITFDKHFHPELSLEQRCEAACRHAASDCTHYALLAAATPPPSLQVNPMLVSTTAPSRLTPANGSSTEHPVRCELYTSCLPVPPDAWQQQRTYAIAMAPAPSLQARLGQQQQQQAGGAGGAAAWCAPRCCANLAVAHTGSSSLYALLRPWTAWAQHLHQARASDLYARGVRCFVTTLRDPAARLVSGFKFEAGYPFGVGRHFHLHSPHRGTTSPAIFVRAFRDSAHPAHALVARMYNCSSRRRDGEVWGPLGAEMLLRGNPTLVPQTDYLARGVTAALLGEPLSSLSGIAPSWRALPEPRTRQ